MTNYFQRSLRIASPCPANWDQMHGDERVRFCQLCQLQVYNVSQLTSVELRALMANGGRVCGKLYQRADGTVITRDCPLGLRAIRRRVVKTAGALLAMMFGIANLVYCQSTNRDQATSHKTNVEIRRETPEGDQLPG